MKTADPVEQLVDDIHLIDPTLHAIVQGVRKLVKRAAPSSTEIVKYGGVMFQAERPFCGVYAYKEHVSLEFGRGHEFEDEHDVLEGSGKFRRHIKLVSPEDLEGRHVESYVRQSLALAQQPPVDKATLRTKRIKTGSEPNFYSAYTPGTLTDQENRAQIQNAKCSVRAFRYTRPQTNGFSTTKLPKR